MKTAELEMAVVNYFNPRENIIIPRVHWGFFIHECDLLVLRKSGRLIEVELKVSLSDLKADKNKSHNHDDKRIYELYYAIPEKLKKHVDLIPERAGVLIAEKEAAIFYSSWYGSNEPTNRITVLRSARGNKQVEKLTDKEQSKLLRLGNLRIWKLKQIILKLKESKNEKRD